MNIFSNLNNFFIAPCFRNSQTQFDYLRKSLQACLLDKSNGTIPYYVNILFTIAAIVAFAYIVYAGYMMFTAFGDEGKYAAAKKTLLYAIIGFAISVAAGVIVRFIVAIFGYTG